MGTGESRDNLWRIVRTHHVGERQQRRLHLRHVAILKQVVGFKDVVGLQAVGNDGADEVGQILQLQRQTGNLNQVRVPAR